ncbi:MAG: PQQ-binding-like beta-propeller repeat protein [Alphaproteobacteria bacterium]|nr:PQQ-binding-like beta-propeller repeat protein [Alphaproteobacteria bacterium]
MKKHIYIYVCFLALAACSQKENLKGHRENIELAAESNPSLKDDAPVVLGDVLHNSNFVQSAYSAQHWYDPLAIKIRTLSEKWSASLDFESSDQIRPLSSTVAAEGKVFCMDAAGIVYAFDEKSGHLIWKISTTHKNKDGQVGGALAFSDGHLIVSTSFAEAFSLDAKTGSIQWRKKIPAPCKGDGITVDSGKAYLLCDNGVLQVLNISDGSVIWAHSGMPTFTTYAGSAGVAVCDGVVYVAYPSGEVFALLENGSVLWSAIISKFSFSNASKSFSHPRACPIVKDNILYVVCASRQITAFDIKNGNILWQRDHGSTQTPALSGNSLFIYDDNSELVCLNKDTGNVKWSKKLSDNSEIVWYGPILSSDGLILTSSKGNVICLSAKDGSTIKAFDADSAGISVPPTVANETLYILGDSGKLAAYK